MATDLLTIRVNLLFFSDCMLVSHLVCLGIAETHSIGRNDFTLINDSISSKRLIVTRII